MSDYSDAIEFFKKIIKLELNLKLEHTAKTQQYITPRETHLEEATHSEEPNVEVESTDLPTETHEESLSNESESSPEIEFQPPEIATPTEELQPRSVPISEIKEQILSEVQSILNSIKRELIEKIAVLESRIAKIETSLSQGVPIAQHEKVSAIPTAFETHSFQTSDVELLLHEANDILSSRDLSLVRLIRLEATEWKLLKLAEDNNKSDKIPKDILQKLRLEINRLRRALLQP